MKSMSFNNQRNKRVLLLEGRQKAPFAPLNHDIRGKSNRLRKTEKGLLTINQPIGYIVTGDEDALTLKDLLANWLVTKDFAVLSFDDEPGRSYEAIVTDINDFSRFSDTRQGTINFLARASLGAEKTINVTTTSRSHAVTGQERTPWKSRTVFTAARNTFSLEADNGLNVVLNYNFIQGDILEIDYVARSVKVNGRDIRNTVSVLVTNWVELNVGTVSIKASHATDVFYTERYL